MAKNSFYAVKIGKNPGIYTTWEECQKQVKGYPGANYKGFVHREEAEAFLLEKVQSQSSSILPSNSLIAYVDGSFFEGRYSYAFLLVQNEVVIFEEAGEGNDEDAASMHNVAGEILAARRAIEYAKSLSSSSLVIFHDYEGIAAWATGAWKAKNEHTQQYRDFVQQMQNEFSIYFQKVKGHSGNPYNEQVDFLAKKALGI